MHDTCISDESGSGWSLSWRLALRWPTRSPACSNAWGWRTRPPTTTLKLSLMTYAVRRGIWLLGFALMIVSFILQAVALHFGRLSQVQPILTLELVFLVAVLSVWLGFTVGRREWLGSLAVRGWPRRLPVLRPPRGGESLRLVLELGDRRARLQRGHRRGGRRWRCAARVGGVPPCSAPPAPSASPSPPPAPRWSPTSPPRTGPRSTGTGRRTP